MKKKKNGNNKHNVRQLISPPSPVSLTPDSFLHLHKSQILLLGIPSAISSFPPTSVFSLPFFSFLLTSSPHLRRHRRLCFLYNPRVLNFPPDFRFFPLFPISFIHPSSCSGGICAVVDFLLFFFNPSDCLIMMRIFFFFFSLFSCLRVDWWFVISLDSVVCV